MTENILKKGKWLHYSKLNRLYRHGSQTVVKVPLVFFWKEIWYQLYKLSNSLSNQQKVSCVVKLKSKSRQSWWIVWPNYKPGYIMKLHEAKRRGEYSSNVTGSTTARVASQQEGPAGFDAKKLSDLNRLAFPWFHFLLFTCLLLPLSSVSWQTYELTSMKIWSLLRMLFLTASYILRYSSPHAEGHLGCLGLRTLLKGQEGQVRVNPGVSSFLSTFWCNDQGIWSSKSWSQAHLL